MFAELLQKPNQKYFIEPIDTFFALSLDTKIKQSDSQLSFQFEQNELIEGSNEQLNVKFCENLLEDDLSYSTEGTSDETESTSGKEKEKSKKKTIKEFIVFSKDSIKKYKDDYVAHIQYQLDLMKSMIYYNNNYKNNQTRIYVSSANKMHNNQYSIQKCPLIYSNMNNDKINEGGIDT